MVKHINSFFDFRHNTWTLIICKIVFLLVLLLTVAELGGHVVS